MLIWMYILAILLMILLPVFLAALFRRRFRVPWLLFCAGMLTFAASQAVHLPLNELLADWGILPEAGREINPAIWQTALVMGLTAGLCEELARAVGYIILRRYRVLEDGVMIGLGHGGVESMVFGGVLVAATVSALLPLSRSDLQALKLSPEQLAALEQQLGYFLASPWMAFAPLLERLLAMGFHVILSLIVLQAFLPTSSRRNWMRSTGIILLAIVYHAAVDAGAVFMAQDASNPWVREGAFALTILPGAAWVWWRYKKEMVHTHPVTSVSNEWTIFLAALRKELFQGWRTRRVLAVAAVFGLFGMASPLMAYFMPQMFKVIPGAEQFASMIPKPTIADAFTQYIKNITQFGFLLAILLGMGAVAGEKERGTASMILSKPMSRWAFILSKFTAQALIYLGGFILALIGAGFYAFFLFGDLDIVLWTGVTALLFLWLLPFAAVTLLGSVIGGTTSAAAGIALVGSVALLLIGSLPIASSFFPSALSGWATLLGAGTPPQTWNGGALAASLVLCVIFLLFGIAIFERQEL